MPQAGKTNWVLTSEGYKPHIRFREGLLYKGEQIVGLYKDRYGSWFKDRVTLTYPAKPPEMDWAQYVKLPEVAAYREECAKAQQALNADLEANGFKVRTGWVLQPC